jgi:peptide-methionine (S)-S-oxide reductase
MTPQPSRRFQRLRFAAPFVVAVLLMGGGTLLMSRLPVMAAEVAVVIPGPGFDEAPASSGLKTARFAGGCFWGVQGVFQHVKGVANAVSGYAGGDGSQANYQAVSTGSTGHAETVEVTYDPKQISYGQLLQVFFSVAHNPTELDRQGPDHGTQYRSAVFPLDGEQKTIAERYIVELDKTGAFGDKIVTTTVAAPAFYPAEAYHQDFLTLNPTYPYIVYNDLPKIENLKTTFPALYRDAPVLVSSVKS